MLGSQESVDLSDRFQLSHDAGQRRAIVVHLGFVHPSLAIGIVKKCQDLIEWLARVGQNVGKRPTLAILEKLLP